MKEEHVIRVGAITASNNDHIISIRPEGNREKMLETLNKASLSAENNRTRRSRSLDGIRVSYGNGTNMPPGMAESISVALNRAKEETKRKEEKQNKPALEPVMETSNDPGREGSGRRPATIDRPRPATLRNRAADNPGDDNNRGRYGEFEIRRNDDLDRGRRSQRSERQS